MCVDRQERCSIIYVVITTAANTHDMKAATNTLDSVIVERPLKKQNLCLDKGYDFPEIERESTTKRRYILHIRHRGEEKELIKIGYPARRWVVEKEPIHGTIDSGSYLQDTKRNQRTILHWFV